MMILFRDDAHKQAGLSAKMLTTPWPLALSARKAPNYCSMPGASNSMTPASASPPLIPAWLKPSSPSSASNLTLPGPKGLRRRPSSHRRRHCCKKCASPYIGERFGENSVGGKWLMGAELRIPLTLLGRRQRAVGGEIISLNCCKWLQINRHYFWTLDFRPWTPAGVPGCGAKRPSRSSGLRRGCRSARPKGLSPCSIIWLRAKTNAKPQAPSNHAPNSNSNLQPLLIRATR